MLAMETGSASAQTYNFTFSGSGVTATGVFNVSGAAIVGISGSVSGFSNATDNGAITGLTSVGSFFSASAPYLNASGVTFQLPSSVTETMQYSGSSYSMYTSDGTVLASNCCSLNVVQTPAPVPGQGLLSWFVLGLGGLLYRRKAIARQARTLAGRLSGRVSAR